MRSYEYYILTETGERVSSRPDPLIESFTTYVVMSADQGYIFRNKRTKRRARDLEILKSAQKQWEEIKDESV